MTWVLFEGLKSNPAGAQIVARLNEGSAHDEHVIPLADRLRECSTDATRLLMSAYATDTTATSARLSRPRQTAGKTDHSQESRNTPCRSPKPWANCDASQRLTPTPRSKSSGR